jgi:hypothetical protein
MSSILVSQSSQHLLIGRQLALKDRHLIGAKDRRHRLLSHRPPMSSRTRNTDALLVVGHVLCKANELCSESTERSGFLRPRRGKKHSSYERQ